MKPYISKFESSFSSIGNEFEDKLVKVNIDLEEVKMYFKALFGNKKVEDLFETVRLEDDKIFERIQLLFVEIKNDIYALENEKYIEYLQNFTSSKKITGDEKHSIEFQLDLILMKLNYNDPEIQSTITSAWGVSKGINALSLEASLESQIDLISKNKAFAVGCESYINEYRALRTLILSMKNIVNLSFSK